MTFQEWLLFDQGHFLLLWSSGAPGRLQSGASLYAKQLEGTLTPIRMAKPLAILTDVWSGRPSKLAQTQQSRSKVCRDGGSHCLPSTRSECRRGKGGSRICSNATFITFPPKQHSNPSYPLLLSSPSHHFLQSSRASTLHCVPQVPWQLLDLTRR